MKCRTSASRLLTEARSLEFVLNAAESSASEAIVSKASKSSKTNILKLSGEICIKSPSVRKRFQDRLSHNIRDALGRAGVEFTLHRHWSRFDVESDDDRAPEILARIFGVEGVIPATAYVWETLEEILDLGEELYSERVAGKKFAVRAQRVGNRTNIPFISGDVNRQLGARLYDVSAGVDLENPEITVGLEVRQKEVFFIGDELDAPGGLPMGSEGKALALMSGGFDSGVAAWMMQKRGVDLDFVFFNLGGPAHERGVRDVTKRLSELWSNGYEPKLHVVDFRAMVAEMKQKISGSYWQLLLKRLMMRAAHQICVGPDGQSRRYPAMLTGESMGQVSSQTLPNLAAIQTTIPTPILRPLVAMNKIAIIDLARNIGTYDISAKVPEFCALEGGHPVTNGSSSRLDREEQKLSQSLLATLVEQRQVHKVFEMASGDEIVDVETTKIPEDAVIIDLRAPLADNAWTYPDSVHLAFEKAIDNVGFLPKDASYVLCCEVGLKSAFLAERMRHSGFDAYSFRGGVAALERHTKTKQPA
jgi:thiamine biosynthesis protein ThiI